MKTIIWFNGTRFEISDNGVYTDFCGFIKLTNNEIRNLLSMIQK